MVLEVEMQRERARDRERSESTRERHGSGSDPSAHFDNETKKPARARTEEGVDAVSSCESVCTHYADQRAGHWSSR